MADKLLACFEYCERRGYAVREPFWIADSHDLWDDLVKLVWAGYADVIVCYDRSGPPPDRIPRIEYATDAPPAERGRRLRRLAR